MDTGFEGYSPIKPVGRRCASETRRNEVILRRVMRQFSALPKRLVPGGSMDRAHDSRLKNCGRCCPRPYNGGMNKDMRFPNSSARSVAARPCIHRAPLAPPIPIRIAARRLQPVTDLLTDVVRRLGRKTGRRVDPPLDEVQFLVMKKILKVGCSWPCAMDPAGAARNPSVPSATSRGAGLSTRRRARRSSRIAVRETLE